MDKTKIDWKEIKDACFYLKDKITKYNPDVLVGIARGGLIPLVLISEMLNNRNIDIIQTELYDKDKKNKNINLRLNLKTNLKNKKVLLIDDVADSGQTLLYIIDILKKQNPKNIKIFTIHYKPKSKIKPDFFYKKVDKWIIYPWDCDNS